jgi:hypothetical protein
VQNGRLNDQATDKAQRLVARPPAHRREARGIGASAEFTAEDFYVFYGSAERIQGLFHRYFRSAAILSRILAMSEVRAFARAASISVLEAAIGSSSSAVPSGGFPLSRSSPGRSFYLQVQRHQSHNGVNRIPVLIQSLGLLECALDLGNGTTRGRLYFFIAGVGHGRIACAAAMVARSNHSSLARRRNVYAWSTAFLTARSRFVIASFLIIVLAWLTTIFPMGIVYRRVLILAVLRWCFGGASAVHSTVRCAHTFFPFGAGNRHPRHGEFGEGAAQVMRRQRGHTDAGAVPPHQREDRLGCDPLPGDSAAILSIRACRKLLVWRSFVIAGSPFSPVPLLRFPLRGFGALSQGWRGFLAGSSFDPPRLSLRVIWPRGSSLPRSPFQASVRVGHKIRRPTAPRPSVIHKP